MKPVQLLRWEGDEPHLCSNAAKQLGELSGALESVVAVVGPAGDGKSTLCNCLLANLEERDCAEDFACGDSVLEGVTRGVWVAVARRPHGGLAVVLDAEGLDMGNPNEEMAITIFASALASHVLYNVRGPRLRRSALGGLLLVNIAAKMAEGLGAEPPTVSLVLRDAPRGADLDPQRTLDGLVAAERLSALPPPRWQGSVPDAGFVAGCASMADELGCLAKPKRSRRSGSIEAVLDGQGLAQLAAAAAIADQGLAAERALLASSSDEDLERAYQEASVQATEGETADMQRLESAAAAAEVAALPDCGSSSEGEP